MTIDEGYIKYQGNWSAGPPIDAALAGQFDAWRRPLFEAGLIGVYAEQGVGFGNLSVRDHDRRFYISGTQTGHLASTDGRHYALVTDYDIDANSVDCTGPVQASSESLTHAAIYELDVRIGAVVHIHSHALWTRLQNSLPTTAANIAYGTPEMAREFERLVRETEFSALGLAIMAGHEDGIVSVGEDLEQAALRALDLNREFA